MPAVAEERVARLDDVRAPAAAGGAGEPAAARVAVGADDAARVLATLPPRVLGVRVATLPSLPHLAGSIGLGKGIEPTRTSLI